MPPSPREVGRFPCAFASALLAGCASCSLAETTPVGERLVVYCRQQPQAERCDGLLGRLRDAAGFALAEARGSAPMTHARALQRLGRLEMLSDSDLEPRRFARRIDAALKRGESASPIRFEVNGAERAVEAMLTLIESGESRVRA